MVVVLGKWQRPKEFKELVRIKSNKETWRKFDREMDICPRKRMITQ